MRRFRSLACYDFRFVWSPLRSFETELSENKGPLKTTLCENETTLFENSPITSALDHINENGYHGA
jgi:hypothetical protein